jgi:hypothetical protein
MSSRSPLSTATLAYWQVSLAYNQRKEAGNISVQKALKVLNTYTDTSIALAGMWRRVHYRMSTLQSNIIQGKPKSKAKGRK